MQEIIDKLHPLERKVVPYLKEHANLDYLVNKTNLKKIEIMRALQWLENKNILTIISNKNTFIELGENGLSYKKDGFPEIKFLKSIEKKPLKIEELTKKSKLSQQEIGFCTGLLKSKSAIEIQDGLVSITDKGKEIIKKGLPEHDFVNNFEYSIEFEKIKDKDLINELIKRKGIINKIEKTDKSISLTPIGQSLIKEIIPDNVVDKLTSDMLKNGTWKNLNFRGYDLRVDVPNIFGGRKHFVNEAIEYAKRLWLEMGFTEMEGNIVQTSFWNLDALFVPQDHPARQMQDTFFIKNPKYGKLPDNWKKIKEVHENGAQTGSTGWKGSWSKEKASELLLRTHTTALSAKTLSNLKEEDLPAKFFCVGKVFRNESLDYKHLFEFYQVDGIVIDKNANMKNLKGYLREFFTKMGYLDIRLRPAHFPYTEPSVEVEVLHPIKKTWIELGGAGIFRPEVVIPLLGKDIPVLAWGLGLDRITCEYWKINDLRDIYKND
ncbi:MAG: phenylalanine--tRNA ligase subunit alpha, partial [Candidatus Woesearchaeota archaeon]